MRHAVILAGGVGERFWPLSRVARPKQFLPLGSDRSLVRETYERLTAIAPPERTWVVTRADQVRLVRRALPELPASQILGEPMGRNTAPAVYLAVLAAMRDDPAATLVTVPSDAWVPDAAPYRKALRTALRHAERSEDLVLVGIRPARPETGYGYIDPVEAPAPDRAVPVRRFVEKPTRARARRFVKGGRHLWNAGIFAWRGEVLKKAVAARLPALAEAFRPLESGRWRPKTMESAYASAPAISVDYGILEQARNAAVVAGVFRWDDLGSWGAMERLGDGMGYAHGETIGIDAPGSILWADDGLVAVLGVRDVVVVRVHDATLVVAKERAQEVRRIVEALKLRHRDGRYTER